MEMWSFQLKQYQFYLKKFIFRENSASAGELSGGFQTIGILKWECSGIGKFMA
jgi:hypothetical protein